MDDGHSRRGYNAAPERSVHYGKAEAVLVQCELDIFLLRLREFLAAGTSRFF